MKLFRKRTLVITILFGISIALKLGALAMVLVVLSAYYISSDLMFTPKKKKDDDNDNG